MAREAFFRRNAATCLEYAERQSDAAERLAWLKRAERWLKLAQEAEAKADDEPLTPSMPEAAEPGEPPPQPGTACA